MEVEIGKDKLKFESRAFSYFGAKALNFARDSQGPDYKADFTARPLSDCLLVIITHGQYMAARRASVFEGGKTESLNPPDPGGSSGVAGGTKKDIFSTEWAKAEMLNLNTSHSKGSFFKLGFLPKPAKPDQLRLLTHGGSDSSRSSSGRTSPVDIRLELDDGQAGTHARTPQARTRGAGDIDYQSSQV